MFTSQFYMFSEYNIFVVSVGTFLYDNFKYRALCPQYTNQQVSVNVILTSILKNKYNYCAMELKKLFVTIKVTNKQ